MSNDSFFLFVLKKGSQKDEGRKCGRAENVRRVQELPAGDNGNMDFLNFVGKNQ